ncbi:hypothetical protein LU474_002604 [Staphylococcus pseudintermedius]|uniref:hypothetical protein n=1 Tax=Staphylococcus pseudintermedius TaxID=283734 RepID=UPI001A00133E|nr:hypothetical protein [Staphylococcus pseudintermedius]EGQ3928015.1 hypothetical protein [Staphylococcus pseudintermedius]EGQ3935368.1 hypothetical protein [Staphylococcus pseudintermedius]EHP0513622.1 hypothetical protein [Staphylococcus pseudintermedius]EHT7951051.1 hypothetical protein [Staphylococcus pseudintermedius]EIQ4001686.1 hypothetical protein [Staphylococcus pseudintermedius]
MLWLIIMIIFVSLLLMGSMIENANLKGDIKLKDYEIEILREQLFGSEGDK